MHITYNHTTPIDYLRLQQTPLSTKTPARTFSQNTQCIKVDFILRLLSSVDVLRLGALSLLLQLLLQTTSPDRLTSSSSPRSAATSSSPLYCFQPFSIESTADSKSQKIIATLRSPKEILVTTPWHVFFRPFATQCEP
jgi:hypothetical protein